MKIVYYVGFLLICQLFCLGVYSQDTNSTFLYTNVFSTIKNSNKQLKQELKKFRFIPSKTLIAGFHEGNDSMNLYISRRVTVPPFLISAFEVTNEEYKAFTTYVKDSIARVLMGYTYDAGDGLQRIDWKKKIDWKNEATLEKIQQMILPREFRIFARKQIDIEKLVYTYSIKNNSISTPVYPDTICWLRDYSFPHNEPMAMRYFAHTAFDNYPVVGISYYQALAFCNWKTQQLTKYLPKDFEYNITYTLPTENEWESAADGSPLYKKSHEPRRSIDMYKPIIFSNKGNNKYNCNFFSIQDENGFTIKGAAEDGALYTVKVDTYSPNKNGLYNMNGNVAEWTLSNGDENVKEYISGIDFTNNKNDHRLKWQEYIAAYPNALFTKIPIDSFINHISQLKIVKGGGWNTGPFYLQNGVNQYYDPAKATSFIGFRYVMHITTKRSAAL